MPILSPLTAKLKAQLKMAINRLRIVQQKETAIAKQQRRFMAELLLEGKEQSAKIRVENIIREDMTIEVLEILELYCELLLARIGLMESSTECDPGLEEAVKTVIWAAPRTEIKELHNIRELLIRKYSKEFAQDAIDNASKIVPDKVVSRLAVEPPKPELVDLYLMEIAKAYKAPYSGLPPSTSDSDGDEDGGSKNKEVLEPVESGKSRRYSGLEGLPDPTDEKSKAPIAVSTPSPTTDNLAPKLKGEEAVTKKSMARHTPPSAIVRPQPTKSQTAQSELDDLRARFEALRR